jgi:large subunit ribosomal protein L6
MIRIIGVGYRASIENKKLALKLGYSHMIHLKIPIDVSVEILAPNRLVLRGCNLHSATQFASIIRSKKVPEPYNGKGIFVGNEEILRKEGKKK